MAALLWLMVWGTYDTEISRVFVPGFPHSTLDLIHGLRSFLPFLAAIIAVVIMLVKRNLPESFFTKPLGLLGIYSAVGCISFIFYKDTITALNWAILYGTVI